MRWINELQIPRQILQFVQHFREGGELVALQNLVKHLLAGGRVIDPVDVFIRIGVDIVVLEQ